MVVAPMEEYFSIKGEVELEVDELRKKANITGGVRSTCVGVSDCGENALVCMYGTLMHCDLESLKSEAFSPSVDIQGINTLSFSHNNEMIAYGSDGGLGIQKKNGLVVAKVFRTEVGGDLEMYSWCIHVLLDG